MQIYWSVRFLKKAKFINQSIYYLLMGEKIGCKWLFYIITIFFLISGCSEHEPYIEISPSTDPLLDKNITIEDSLLFDKNTEIDESITSSYENITEETEEYTLEQLQKDISFAYGYNITLKQKVNDSEYDPDYYDGNGIRFVVVNIHDEIHDGKEFYDKFSAKNWEAEYYRNRTRLNWLQQEMTRDNFSSDRLYDEYMRDRWLIDKLNIEKVYNLTEGAVLEQELSFDIFDRFGYYSGVWDSILIMYKIYCAPNMTVILRPKWSNFNLAIVGSSSTKEALYKNRESDIKMARSEMLKIADKILKKCPVKKEFFEDIPRDNFSDSESFFYYWKVRDAYFRNLSSNITATIKPFEARKGTYYLESLNYTLKNGPEVIDWSTVFLDVETISDGDSESTFLKEKMISRKKIDAERLIVRNNMKSEVEPRFKNNLTIKVKLNRYFYGNIISPYYVVVDTNGTIIEKGSLKV